MARQRGDISQQNSFEPDYAGTLNKKEQSTSLQDMFDLTFKFEGMKTYVDFDPADQVNTGITYALKPVELCNLDLGAYGSVLQHWAAPAAAQVVIDELTEEEILVIVKSYFLDNTDKIKENFYTYQEFWNQHFIHEDEEVNGVVMDVVKVSPDLIQYIIDQINAPGGTAETAESIKTKLQTLTVPWLNYNMIIDAPSFAAETGATIINKINNEPTAKIEEDAVAFTEIEINAAGNGHPTVKLTSQHQTNMYLLGLIGSGTITPTPKAAPVTGFTATGQSSSEIILNWTNP